MNLTTLRALQSRVRECKGADSELDCLIACALLGGEPHRLYPSGFGNDWRRNVGRAYFNVSPYTTYPDGLGACVSLLEAVLPGAKWGRDPNGDFEVSANRMFFWSRARANDCLTFIDAIISAAVAEIEAKEAAR